MPGVSDTGEKMDISELTIRLIVLLLPGMIASLIIEKLTVHSKWEPFKFVIYSVILGMLSYSLYQCSLYIIETYNYFLKRGYNPTIISFWSSLFNSQEPISVSEVFVACIHSVFVGLIMSKIVHYKYL